MEEEKIQGKFNKSSLLSIFYFLKKKKKDRTTPHSPYLQNEHDEHQDSLISKSKSPAYYDLLINWLKSEFVSKTATNIIEEKLKEISRVTETKTLDLTKKFQTLYTNSKDQNQLMQELATLSSGILVEGELVKIDDIAVSVQQTLSKVTNFLKELSSRAESVVLKMDQADKTLLEIVNSIKEIELINKKTKYLSINSMIEATKTGEDKEGAMAVANEVRELANDTQSITTIIKEQSQQMRFALTETQRILKDVAALDLSESIQAESEIKKMIDGLVVNNQKMTKIMDVTSKSIHEFSDTAGNLVKGVQFQDRLQQDIQELTKELSSVNKTFVDVQTKTMEMLEVANMAEIVSDADLHKLDQKAQILLSESCAEGKEGNVELF